MRPAIGTHTTIIPVECNVTGGGDMAGSTICSAQSTIVAIEWPAAIVIGIVIGNVGLIIIIIIVVVVVECCCWRRRGSGVDTRDLFLVVAGDV